MLIEDGGGSGQTAKIGGDGRLKTYALTEREDLYENEENGDCFSILVSKTPAAGGNNCFFYIKNNSDKNLNITSMKVYSASAETIQIKLNDIGTPANGTTNTPVSRNAGSGKIADCVCQDGTDITGLSGGTVVDDLNTGTTMTKWDWGSNIIIPKNRTLTLYAVTTEVAIRATLSVYFH